ncbi:MAG: CoA pyrophosphatase [Silicimonas sp.]|nr:CoA pyrophosphatase [Silicimonas sp.]
MRDLRARLTAALAADGPPSSDYDLNPNVILPETRKLRAASVLIPVVAHDHGASVLLTKRSSALKHHPGQIAFPGGKEEAGDNGPEGAALREAWEEIALPEARVEVLGRLPAHETVTGFQVTPVLALIEPGFTPRPDAGEVAEAFEVPLAHVITPENYIIEGRRWRGQRRSYFTVPWGPYYIWGATARMLRALADRMDHGAD